MFDYIMITFCFLIFIVFGMPIGAFFKQNINKDKVCSALYTNTYNYQACKARAFVQVVSEIKPVDMEVK